MSRVIVTVQYLLAQVFNVRSIAEENVGLKTMVRNVHGRTTGKKSMMTETSWTETDTFYTQKKKLRNINCNYMEEVTLKGHLFKACGMSIAYCPECGEPIHLDGTEEKRTRPDGEEEILAYCNNCDLEFWAHENYFTELTRQKREQREEALKQFSKEDLIKMILIKEHLL